ncbi:MAG TPA: glycosyltransferase family 2 protein, partial [Parvularculaceae bacterium]|nr:glycosyltransferase family 2 protein [Parvularculaceae bacterium]
GFILDAGWIDAAVDFMQRRPEVAAIEGHVCERFARGSAFNAAAERAIEGEDGEIQSVGSTAFMRADAFEAAGGFRGDLPVNETRDLCVRLRRRGEHIWRLDCAMGMRDSNLGNFSDWFAYARRAGYEYAHGAALHGARPERLFLREKSRASFWGAGLPILLALAAVGAWFAVGRLGLPFNALAAAGGVLAAGAFIYLLRIFAIALRRGAGRPSSWAYAFLLTLGHASEAFGAWRYHFGGSRAERAKRAAA